MKALLIILLVGSLNPVFAVTTDTDLSPYISKLEDAAKVCDNSMFSTSECTKICTASAEQFKQAKTFSGISGEGENAVMNCVTAMAANDDGRNSPLFKQVGALQATLSTELFKLKMAHYGQQALAKSKISPGKAVAQQVSIDTNIYAANGQVDSDKIPALYDDLSQHCQNQDGDMMKKLCSDMCQSKKTEVEEMLVTIKQAPKNISAADEVRNTYNLLQTIEIDLNSSCGNIYRQLSEAQQPKSYLALVEFVGLIKKGVWPPKPALSLDLALEEPTPEVKQAEQFASVTGANALNTYSFSQAISVIKSMPDYQSLAEKVQGIPYSVKQISSSLSDLISKESSYSSQRQQWQDKVQELGLVGRQKELYEALNSQCDIDYLRTYNQPMDWNLKVLFKPAPLEQKLSPVYLHRFCYEQLAGSLNSQYAQTTNRAELQALADTYIN